MALVMEDSDICSNWEEIEENSDILDKQLARLKLEKSKREEAAGILVKNNNLETGNGTDKMMKTSASIVLDSTTQESLRTQYAPPEPKMTILMRPKETNNSHNRRSHSDNKTKNVASKSLQQREQEYAEARMRILGDVRFEAEEAEAAEAQATPTLSPAEILKLKIAEAIRGDLSLSTTPNTSSSTNLATSAVGPGSGAENNNIQPHHQNPGHVNGPHNGPGRGGRNKRSREKPKIKTTNPETTRDFPVHKTDSEFIHRHPRGPDGTTGFQLKRT